MRRMIGASLIALMLAPIGARAATVWTCEHDGRIGGRQSGLCATSAEAGSYTINIVGLTRETSGELRVTVNDELVWLCNVVANMWSCDDETRGAGQTGSWPTLDLELLEPASVGFRVRPVGCGTVTCDREPQIIAGRFRLTLATAT